MAYTLHELRAADGRAFSPFCWRARMALAHKGIVPVLRPSRFSDIREIGHGCRTVPVLFHGGACFTDSWDIAVYLERELPDAARLFAGAGDRHYARFLHHWAGTQLHPTIFRTIAADICDRLDPADQRYFRETREARLGGAKLESVRENQAVAVAQFRAALAPVRSLLEEQAFVAGTQPAYPDYIVFGALQWARVISPVPLLDANDPVRQWFERCLDLHGGLGRGEPAAV
jgi:glutathione S-transferase